MADDDAVRGERDAAMDATAVSMGRRPPGTLQGVLENPLFIEVVVSTAKELMMCVEVYCGGGGSCGIDASPLRTAHSTCLAGCT